MRSYGTQILMKAVVFLFLGGGVVVSKLQAPFQSRRPRLCGFVSHHPSNLLRALQPAPVTIAEGENNYKKQLVWKRRGCGTHGRGPRGTRDIGVRSQHWNNNSSVEGSSSTAAVKVVIDIHAPPYAATTALFFCLPVMKLVFWSSVLEASHTSL